MTFNEITTGASSDISAATSIARRMVCEWGMSDKLGPLSYGKKEGDVFLGKEFGHQQDYSDSTADQIDEEVRSIIDEQLDRSRKILKDNEAALKALAEALLRDETLDANQVEAIVSSNGGPGGGGEGKERSDIRAA